jgi:hypothetical protein
MSSRSERNRESISRFIEAKGYEVLPCSRCERKGLSCRMDDSRSKKCGECVISARRCDSSGIPLTSCRLFVYPLVEVFLADRL